MPKAEKIKNKDTKNPKNAPQDKNTQEKKHYDMKASVMGDDVGAVFFKKVLLVRVVSSDYNLMILRDYMPVLGEVHGSVTIVTETDERAFSGIHGYYMNSHNEFSLLITSKTETEEFSEIKDTGNIKDSADTKKTKD